MSTRSEEFPWRDDRDMYTRLDPIIRAEVRTFLLSRRLPSIPPDDVMDLVGDVWVHLLKDERKELRKWDSTRGVIEVFVSIKTRSRMQDKLRARNRREGIAPTVPLERDPREGVDSPEAIAAAAQLARQLDACVQRRLGKKPKHLEAFRLEFHEDCPAEELEAVLEIGREQHYRIRFEIVQALKRCLKKIEGKR